MAASATVCVASYDRKAYAVEVNAAMLAEIRAGKPTRHVRAGDHRCRLINR